MVVMSTPVLPQLRQLLAERASQLEQDIATRQGRVSERVREVSDSKDEAESQLAGEIDEAEVRRDLMELREIAAARARIDDGSYGRCTDCDTPIDSARLLAQPTAARCLGCQSLLERPDRATRRHA